MLNINFTSVFLILLKFLIDNSACGSIFDTRIDKMPEKCCRKAPFYNCFEITECTNRSGIYELHDKQFSELFFGACDAETAGGGWLVIQKRQDGSVDFSRSWSDYEKGFGDVEGEYFIGLRKLYALTNFNGPQELLILMENKSGVEAFAKYNSFAIGDAMEMYKLKRLGKYTGTAGNSLQHHLGMKFSTIDRDYDENPEKNCAAKSTGGWWFKKCGNCNLNGLYDKRIFWDSFRSRAVPITFVKIMIRRSRSV